MQLPFGESFAQLVVDASPDGLVVADADGRIVYLNAAAERLFRWAAAELVGQPVERLLPEALRDRHRLHVQRYAGQPQPRPMGAGLTLQAARADGSTLPVEVSLSPLRTEAGVLVMACVRDVSERERANEALRRSEQHLRTLIARAPEPVFVADRSARFNEANQAACTLLGYTREELCSLSIADVIPAADAPRLQMTRERLQQAGQVEFSEWTLLRKDGVAVPVEITASMPDEDHLQLFARDISVRKRAEARLREGEESLLRAQRVAGLGSWEWNLLANTATRSDQLYRIFGLTPGPTAEAPFAFTALIPDEDRRRLLEALAEAVRTLGSYAIEHRVLRPDGQERICLSQGEVIAQEGRPARCVGTTLDITELRLAERGRERALGELKAVLEQCPVGITIIRGKRGESLESNRQAREIQGNWLDPSQGLAQLEGYLLDAEGRPLPLATLPGIRALAGETVPATELLFKRRDGGPPLPIEVSAAPVRDPSGEVAGAVLVSRDISLAKQLERLRAEWNSVVAHDLRQPISNIALYTALIGRQSAGLPEKVTGQVLEIKRETARLARMTHDLLDLSRLDASRLRLELRKMDVVPCVKACVERVALEFPERRVELKVASPLPPIAGDYDRLTQVVENLLSNALKYGAADAPIRVSLECEGAGIALAVSNEGDGISPEAQAQLFRRFQRVGESAQKIAGIGLGLQITQGLVEAHGGRISVHSVPHGTTTFRCVLPAAHEA